jgi:hypothetical protein
MDTKAQVEAAFDQARCIFREKMVSYGPAWLGLSPLGFADQIYIKAHRYKTLLRTKERKIDDPPELELYAIINYCVLFLIARNRETLTQIFDSPTAILEPLSENVQEKLIACYQQELDRTVELQRRKDHDYGSAWEGLSHEGLADILLTKTLRIKAMLSSGKTLSDDKDTDGIVASLRDLINYSAFALVLSY